MKKSRGRTGLTLLLGMLTAFGPLSIDLYLPAFPHIARELGVEVGAVEFTLAAYLFGSAAGQLIYGPIADRFGRRAPLLVGCLIFAAGALACAAAANIGVLAVSRVVQALGGAAGMVIARAVVRDLFDPREAAHMFSQLMLVMGICPVLAPSLGGQMLAWTGWRTMFWLLAGFGTLCFATAAAALPETLPVEKRIRGGLGTTLNALVKLARERHFVAYALIAGLGSGTLFSYISGAPYVFIELHGVSAQHFGIFFGANAAGYIGAAQLNRWLLHRYSPAVILNRVTWAGLVCGLALAVSGATGWGGLPALSALLFATLAMLGIAVPNVAAAALAPYGYMAGSASALLGTMQFLVGSIAGAVVGALHNGTAIPMTVTVAASCVGSFVVLRTLAPTSTV